MGKAAAPAALPVDAVLALFSSDRGVARRAFSRFVAQGVGADDPSAQVTNQVFLGSDAFVAGKGSGLVLTRLPWWLSIAKCPVRCESSSMVPSIT